MNTHRCCASDPSVQMELEEELQRELKDIPDDEQIEKHADVFSTLSHPMRLKIAYILLKRDYCVCEIVQLLKKKPNLVSHHLMKMRSSGIVRSYMQSKWKYYRLSENIGAILQGIEKN